MKTKLWIVGEYILEVGGKAAWDFVGVFDSEERAIAACKKENHFVGPAELNGKETFGTWRGAYYPISEAMKEES
jgi:hypothetical protein